MSEFARCLGYHRIILMDNNPSFFKEIRLLWNRKLIIISISLFAGLTTYFVSTILPKTYTASSEVLLQSLSSSGSVYGINEQPLSPTQMATDVQLFNSTQLKQLIKKRLGFTPEIQASQVGSTSTVQISASSNNAQQAARIANVYAQAFISIINQQQLQQINLLVSAVSHSITSLTNEQSSLLAQLGQLGNSASDAATREAIQQKLDFVNSQLLLLSQQLSSLEIEQQSATSAAQLILVATPPKTPSFPQPLKFSLISFVGALATTIVAILLLERLDQTIKSKHTLERLAEDLPVLGIIPEIPSWKSKENVRAITIHNSSSPVAESYRALRTALQFTELSRKISTLQITSPGSREGKSLTCANLAVAMAESGLKVIAACADLRIPKLHEYFNIENKKGLTSLLLNETSIEATLIKAVTATGQLYVLPAGPKPPNPAELLASVRMQEIMAELSSMCDLLILDSPPILPVTDACIISRLVDATIVVAMVNLTTIGQFKRSLEILNQVEAPIIGTILNGAPAGSDYGYSYLYSYASSYYDTRARHAQKIR